VSKVESRVRDQGMELPETPQPVAAYVAAVECGSFVYTAGQIPRIDGELVSPGRVGAEVSQEEGRLAARRAALQAISALKSAVDDLDRIDRVVKVTVFVCSAPGFGGQPFVADGASELFQLAFGERGKHSRSAVGVAELPLGACVEVEVIAHIGPP